MKCLVNVTCESISQGKRNKAYRCMVSHAVRATICQIWDLDTTWETMIAVTASTIKFNAFYGENIGQFHLTEDLTRKIIAWDNEEEIEPFSFELTIPDAFVRYMNIPFRRREPVQTLEETFPGVECATVAVGQAAELAI